MNHQQLRDILEQVEKGRVSVEHAQDQLVEMLRRVPFEDIGFSRIDHHRPFRQGIPEAVSYTHLTLPTILRV